MTARPAPLPPLPKTIATPAGPWYVVRTTDGLDANDYGRCDWETRTIKIRPSLRRTAAWLTLEHEWVHAVLYDAGVCGLSHRAEEDTCNALALALIHRRRSA